MPWHVDKSAECPVSEPWAVIKDADGKVVGCHETEADALDQLAALNINVHDAEPEQASRPPRDNLVRAMPGGYELRDTDSEMPVLTGHFSVFNEWTRIDSAMEGLFMERVAPGAFRKTIAEHGEKVKVLFNHGKDPSIGDKVLGMPDILEEDERGARYEVPLFDTSYNRDLLPGLRAGAYGSSFRFRVVRDDMDRKPKTSDRNPDAIPERTIREAELFEFGPVTWPAYAGATAGIRSMTDEYALDIIAADPARLRQMVGYLEPEPAPSVDAGASPHLEPERRDTAPPIPPPEAVATPIGPANAGPSDSQEHTVEYVTREEKVSRVSEVKDELSRLAVATDGELSAADQATWDGLVKEQDVLERAIAAWDKRQAKIRENAEKEENRVAGFTPPTVIRVKSDAEIGDIGEIRSGSRTEEEFHQGLRDNAMRMVERASFPHPEAKPDAAKAGIQRLLDHKDSSDKELARRILTTGTPLYQRTFNKIVAGVPLSNEENRAAALAVTGTTTTGGYMVPYVLDPTLLPIGAWTSVVPYRAACRVETIVGGNNWRAVTATNVAAIYEAEGAAATEAGPTIGQPTLTAQRASSFVTVSYETMADRPDIASELAVLIQEGKDTLEEAQYTAGVGTTVYPQGMFLTAAFTNLDTATDNVTAVADIYRTEAALPIRYRANAAWFMARSSLHQIQAWETTGGTYFGATVGYPYVGTPETNRAGNTGIKILGYPVWEVPSAVSTFTTNSAIIIVFVDPKSYIILDRAGMNIEVIPNLFDGAGKPMGQRGVYAFWRNTARPVNALAGVSLSVQ